MGRFAPDVASLLAEHGVLDPTETPLVHNGFSGARISTVQRGEERLVLKRVRLADDWIMRLTRDETCREAEIAASPLSSRLPAGVVMPSIGVARDGDGFAILMRDLSSHLLPDDQPIDDAALDLLLSSMAAMHAAFWDDPLPNAGVAWCPTRERITLLAPSVGAMLFDEGRDFGLAEGWRLFDELAPPEVTHLASRLFDDPAPLVDVLESLPQTWLHGDVKLGNTAIDTTSGVVWLFDWALTMVGPIAIDLAWFPAVNTPQLPCSPDDVIDRYGERLRQQLGERGFAAAEWPRQRAAASLARLMLMGWAKAHDAAAGREHELAWICGGATEGARTLGW